jgi:lysophospholipase L1-like esterase
VSEIYCRREYLDFALSPASLFLKELLAMRLLRPAFRFALIVATAVLTACPGVAASSATLSADWVGTWGAAIQTAPNTEKAFAQDTTLRQIVHVSVGGTILRVVMSNELGTTPLRVGGASVAIPGADGSIEPASAIALGFSGHPSVTIPAGGVAVSDPFPFHLTSLSNLAITMFVPAQAIPRVTRHDLALQTNYVASGNQLNAASLQGAAKSGTWQFLKDVEVQTPKGAAIVALGDSITDGWRSTSGTNRRWPDVLAERLQADSATRTLGVLNEGISGNRILQEGWGPSVFERFDRDVLAPAGVKYLILMEGINDIGRGAVPSSPQDAVTAETLITGFSQLARQAHTHGLKIFGATLTPYVGAGYASPAGEAMRQALNNWIRTTRELDGFIDFDKATRSPKNPAVFGTANDSDDHLHPNDTGYKVMGDAIDLKLFSK